jgi:hypothetical protein
VLIVGLIFAALASGWGAWRELAVTSLRRWLFTGAIAAMASIATLYLSLFIILNTRGS